MQDILKRILPPLKEAELTGERKMYLHRHSSVFCQFPSILGIFNDEIMEVLGFRLMHINSETADVCFKQSDSFKEEEYSIVIKDRVAYINAGGYKGMLYAAYTLVKLIKLSNNSLSELKIHDYPGIKTRGFYHDVSRGKVPSLGELKKIVNMASHYHINEMQLYIEHSFAFEGMQQVWFDKDPLKPEEILELDRYASDRGIELIPSLSSFGHLYEVLRTPKFKALCERNNPDAEPFNFIDRMRYHTLDPLNEESLKYALQHIDNYARLFKSNKFNICCDETFDLCGEKNKAIKDDENKVFQTYTDFVLKIYNHLKKQGKVVMMWDDIILNAKDISHLPEDIIYLDWDYCANPSEENRAKIAQKKHSIACSGSSTWNRLICNYENMFSNQDNMLAYCQKYGMEGYYLTNWGDFGDIQKTSQIIIPLAYAGSISWGPKVLDSKEDFLKNLSLIELADESILPWMLDIANYHIVTYLELVFAISRKHIQEHNMQEYMLNTASKLENIDYTKLNAIKELMYSKLSTCKNKQFILDVLNIIDGIKLFNSFDILSYQFNNDYDKLCQFWYDYCEDWRKVNKESELMRNTEHIRELIRQFRSTK